MKKIFFLSTLFFGLFFCLPAFAQEKIDSFDVTIKINSGATINVSERIQYDFGDLQKHGIFRAIPIKYEARGGNFNLRISDISVADENGNPYKFQISYPTSDIQIKIGDADQFVSGQKIYVINYTIGRAINYFSDHDELYWNATGNEWQVPIEKSSAKIILPSPIEQGKLDAICFAGALGSNQPCTNYAFKNAGSGLASEIDFSQLLLTPGQGLTIAVSVPKGVIAKPSTLQNILETIKDNWIVFLPFLTFFIMLYLWYTRGRDPKGRGTVIAQYEAPDNLTPAQIGTLIDEKVDAKDISSEIIYLATKGFLKITRTQNKGFIFSHEDYLLEKLKEPDALAPAGRRLMEALFPQSLNTKKLSDLKNKFYKDVPDIKSKLYDSLVKEGYFPESPVRTKTKYIIIGVLVLGGVFLLGELFAGAIGSLGIISLIVSSVLVIIFSLAMPVKTKKGVDAKEDILGLKEYLSVAEKDRIKFFNAPEKNPERFEALLPYAMVLGVEQEWAKQFEGIYKEPPSWYSDPSGHAFNSLILIHSLNNFNHSASSALFSAPRGASGGGSGFGGGGFSGGGFGGGGGGSW
ncbi:MAG: DUF2207 domain-containing protein [bacterium]